MAQSAAPPNGQQAWPYCATCDATYNSRSLPEEEKVRRRQLVKLFKSIPVNDLLIGRRFECPRASLPDPHVAAVVTGPGERHWLWLQHLFARYQSWRLFLVFMPLLLVLMRPLRKGWQAWVSVGVTISLLVVALLYLAPQGGYLTGIAYIVAFVIIVDLVLINTSTVFVTQKPRNPLRTIVFAMFAFVELAVAFAVLYLSLPEKQMNRELGRLDAVYFSFVTIATLGYGDIQPREGARHAELLVVSEILMGLYFLAVILTSMVSWANPQPGLPILQALLAESDKLNQNAEFLSNLTQPQSP